MSQHNLSKIEKYKAILLKNPRSPVFPTLADAYRKMGMLQDALKVTKKGLKHQPEFISALVAHSRILFELKDYKEAMKTLKKVIGLSPQNLWALRLKGLCHLKLCQYLEAFSCLKKLLALKPDDQQAQELVSQLDFIETVPEGPDPITFTKDGLDQWVSRLPSAEQAVFLIDKFLMLDRKVAENIAHCAHGIWPTSQELKQRLKLLAQKEQNSQESLSQKELTITEQTITELSVPKSLTQKEPTITEQSALNSLIQKEPHTQESFVQKDQTVFKESFVQKEQTFLKQHSGKRQIFFELQKKKEFYHRCLNALNKAVDPNKGP